LHFHCLSLRGFQIADYLPMNLSGGEGFRDAVRRIDSFPNGVRSEGPFSSLLTALHGTLRSI
jgi:hypothetical protein